MVVLFQMYCTYSLLDTFFLLFISWYKLLYIHLYYVPHVHLDDPKHACLLLTRNCSDAPQHWLAILFTKNNRVTRELGAEKKLHEELLLKCIFPTFVVE